MEQLEDPDARPRRFVVLAASGMAIATVFATTAAVVGGTGQQPDAAPDFTLKPTSTYRSTTTTTTSSESELPPPPPVTSEPTSSSSTATTTTGE